MAWKNDGQNGRGSSTMSRAEPLGSPGSAKSSGNGVAGVVGKDGRFILFR